MRHCCEFDAFDIWYLKDNDEFSNRTFFIGICPICEKSVCILVQRKIKTNSFISTKKAGKSAVDFTDMLRREKVLSRNELNRMKFKSRPFGWRYGVNKQVKSKDGKISIEQYAVDFNGSAELIKKL